MFRIKICGITTVEDALLVARAGADAIGLNFYPQSPRYLPPDHVRPIVESLPPGVVKIGLFVNAGATEVCRTFDEFGLDLVQLHGDEPPEYLPHLGSRPVMRAFRLAQAGLSPVFEYLQQCCRLGCPPHCVLIDSFRRGQYGGTGKTADWEAVANYHLKPAHPPLVLAGGLAPENVANAIRAVRPAAVDTASGVERSPGRKDPDLVARFVAAARGAL